MDPFEEFLHPKQTPNPNIEDNLTHIMDAGLLAASFLKPNVPEDILKAMIVAYNLKALVEVILLSDTPESEFTLDKKKVALGLLATSDWLMPDLDVYDAE